MEPPASEDDFVEPPSLRFLRRLVTVLTAVMIGGLVILVGAIVIRSPDPVVLPLPDTITLPDGARPQAVTYGRDALIVLGEDNRLFIFDATGETLRRTIDIE